MQKEKRRDREKREWGTGTNKGVFAAGARSSLLVFSSSAFFFFFFCSDPLSFFSLSLSSPSLSQILSLLLQPAFFLLLLLDLAHEPVAVFEQAVANGLPRGNFPVAFDDEFLGVVGEARALDRVEHPLDLGELELGVRGVGRVLLDELGEVCWWWVFFFKERERESSAFFFCRERAREERRPQKKKKKRTHVACA